MGKTNADDLEWSTLERGETKFRRKQLAAAAGGEELGCSLYELPEGRRSWPYHYHTGNEEALFVLEGTGTLRLDGETLSLEDGDYVALPRGEDGAHRIVNDSDGPLRYLMLSTMTDPDVTVYPDSGKVGVFAGSPPGGDGDRTVSGYFREDDAVSYWEDEEQES
ncbi:cupin domain-containing protein [Natronobacterium texcoconense]|uniref:Cupin domain-containing protein n=1 Tax=Natronobacterium texcoconense TaxID=1095778 RepID=A0A1H0YX38_NATTX|nr:cupin domain-containing protein [Natronobacterium texcoconense]SDQ19713.1 Cupin domain-containing protein [Natronobacterium texcoconense]